jgi:aryl-alcohol dehydrogenase-like predicted oxidoreductase
MGECNIRCSTNVYLHIGFGELNAMNRRDVLEKFTAAAALASWGSANVQGSHAQQAAPAKPPTNMIKTAAEMLTRKIQSTGESLPVIGLGTWQTFDVGSDAASRAPLEEVMREFVALGGKVIDSSPMYGRSEDVAGEIIAKLKLREKLFIATKVWTSGKSAGVAQMEASMTKLHAKPIDLMQVHNLLDVETHLDTLGAWKREGRVRHLGVTHYTASAYDAVAKIIAKHPVDTVQINYSIGEREAEQRLLPLARERGIAVIVNRPFAGGELFRRLRATPLPSWAGEINCTSWAQLMLKFVISYPAVTCAIPGTGKLEHLLDNMAAGVGQLPDDKMRMKIAASAGVA